jgi:hypothetical protein
MHSPYVVTSAKVTTNAILPKDKSTLTIVHGQPNVGALVLAVISYAVAPMIDAIYNWALVHTLKANAATQTCAIMRISFFQARHNQFFQSIHSQISLTT